MSTLAVGTIKSISSAAPVFQNTSGTEKGQLAKSWINFNGSGTIAIRDSFNVSSIADEGTGQYQVNFTNNMATASDYVVVGSRDNFQAATVLCRNLTASSYDLAYVQPGVAFYDSNFMFAAVFGDN